MMLLLLAACLGTSSKGGDVVLSDANNYSYTASLTIETTEVTLGENFDIDWSGLTTDFLGHEIAATEITQVYLLWFKNLEPDAVAAGLADNSITQTDLDWAATFNTSGETSVNTANLDFAGNPFDASLYLSQDRGTYMIRLVTGMDQTADSRMLAFVDISSESTNQSVSVTDNSAALDFSVDLQSLTPLSVAADSVPYVDWTGLTTDGVGASLDFTDLSELWIAGYDGMATTDLQSQFLDLELIYTDLYTTSMYGESGIETEAAVDDAGGAFPGFAAGTTWLMALRCPDYCTSPAPPFLTVVNVE